MSSRSRSAQLSRSPDPAAAPASFSAFPLPPKATAPTPLPSAAAPAALPAPRPWLATAKPTLSRGCPFIASCTMRIASSASPRLPRRRCGACRSPPLAPPPLAPAPLPPPGRRRFRSSWPRCRAFSFSLACCIRGDRGATPCSVMPPASLQPQLAAGLPNPFPPPLFEPVGDGWPLPPSKGREPPPPPPLVASAMAAARASDLALASSSCRCASLRQEDEGRVARG